MKKKGKISLVTETEITPFVEKERTKCPFYGFCYIDGVFVDLGGDQCLFIEDHPPCKMDVPDWKKCNVPKEHQKPDCLKEIENCKIFPKEFCPPGKFSWDGISFKKWVEYIKKGKEDHS